MARRGSKHGPSRETYAQRRRSLLIELRVMRLTNPSKRVVKHMQRLMRALRWMRREGAIR